MSGSSPDPVSDDVLNDLRQRLAATRHVRLPEGVGWARGTDQGFLRELVQYWGTSYDWREHEKRIRALPWVRTGSGARALRCIHRRASRSSAPVVVLLHGWPDSVLRFERVLALLSDVHVVVPALPGFPFGEELREKGMSVTRMAAVLADALQELGYERYVLSGGDIGGDVAEQLAAAYPQRVSALHLTNLSPRRFLAAASLPLSPMEQEAVSRIQHWRLTEGGYIAEQSTKPHSLAPGLNDSPVGLAAWLVEKLRSWSDCGADLESVLARDELLTWVTAYWVTGTIGSSFSGYVEPPNPLDRLETPTVMSCYRRDINVMPRAFVERFLNIRVWNDHDAGGHFAAWEQPQSYARGVREALAL